MLTHNAHQVSAELELHGQAMEDEFSAFMNRVAQEAARKVRELAPKWRSTLANSITPWRVDRFTWEVRVGAEHGLYREKGQKPGKHLPRFFDPAAKGIVDWLASHAFKGARRVSRGTRAFMRRELELRDRYMALSWHVFHKGLKAQPFVEPVGVELQKTFPARVEDLVKRMVAQANGGAA